MLVLISNVSLPFAGDRGISADVSSCLSLAQASMICTYFVNEVRKKTFNFIGVDHLMTIYVRA